MEKKYVLSGSLMKGFGVVLVRLNEHSDFDKNVAQFDESETELAEAVCAFLNSQEAN